MTRFYGWDPEYQLRMPAQTWLFYSRSVAAVSALEQMWGLGVAHSAEPQKLMRSLRKAAAQCLGGRPRRRKTMPGKKAAATGGTPVLEQVAPLVMKYPQLREFITIRRKPPEK